MRLILENTGDSSVADEIMSLWLDYEESSSIEALLAHQLDKFEMIVQAGKNSPCLLMHQNKLSFNSHL